MACLGIAMDPCRLYPSFHVRLRNYKLGLLLPRHFGDKALLSLARSYPHSLQVSRGRRRMDVVVHSKLSSGHDGHRNLPEHGTQGKQQHRKLPETTFSNRHRGEQRKKKKLRLRGRLRLVLRNLRQWWSLREAIMYIHSNWRSKMLSVSVILGCTVAMGCLCLKFSSVPAPHSVPYSELVMHLKSGTVTSALFEEGSRHVFFNVRPSNSSLDNEEAGYRSPDSDAILHISQEDPSVSNVKSTALPGEIEQNTTFEDTEHTSAEKYKTLGKQYTAILTNGGMSKLSAITSAINSSLQGVAGASEKLTRREPHPWQYSSRRVENDEPYLLQLMRETGVTYGSAPQPMSTALRTTLITILSLWIPLTPLLWMMYKHISGSNSLSQKRRLSKPDVKFHDVAGVDEAKTELVEIVSYLQGATNFKILGAKLPKGVLLVGPPGTGKTLLARAVAGEAGVPFFSASASEFVEMFVGRGAARIRDLFSVARKSSPSIIFIDELDAVGGRRGRSFNDERDQTLNQLLTEMDGFEADAGVLVIAATNRPEALDPALCRSGRFSRKVFVKEPDLKGRQKILAVHLRDVPVEGDLFALQSSIASITAGFVGADLACVVNEATLLAIRAGRLAVTIEDLKEAVSRVKYGVGNRPAFTTTVERMFDWLQPKSLKSNPVGYEAPSWSG